MCVIFIADLDANPDACRRPRPPQLDAGMTSASDAKPRAPCRPRPSLSSAGVAAPPAACSRHLAWSSPKPPPQQTTMATAVSRERNLLAVIGDEVSPLRSLHLLLTDRARSFRAGHHHWPPPRGYRTCRAWEEELPSRGHECVLNAYAASYTQGVPRDTGVRH